MPTTKKTAANANPYYSWLKQLEGKDIEVYTVSHEKRDCTYNGTLMFVDKSLVAMRETSQRITKVHIFPLHEVREIIIPEAIFRVKSKVKIKEVA